MRSNNVLEPIWSSYQTTLDCLKVARRSIKKGDSRLIEKTVFASDSIDDATAMIEKSSDNANDFVIVSLWAVFERKLLDYLKNAGRGTVQNAALLKFSQKFHEKIESEIEYWKINDILDIFKSVVDADLIGYAKSVKKYRDWVAHKNPKKTPSNVTPLVAYKVLTDIIDRIDKLDNSTPHDLASLN